MNTISTRMMTLAGLLSTLLAIMGAIWLWRPGWNGFESADALPAALLLDPARLPLLGLGLGVTGAVAAAIALSLGRRFGGVRPRWLVIVAALLTLGALSLIGTQAITGAGYTLALLMPLIGAVLLVQAVRKGGRGRWIALVVTGLLLAVGVLTGVLSRESVGVFAEIGPLFLQQVPSLLVPTLLVVLALTWTMVGVGAARDGDTLQRLAGWVLRNRTAITVVAALGPLPYALVRLTWLTPWKVLSPTDDLPAETVLWGLMLSTGAWLGFFLTLGLIQRWGEVFPRWVPFLAGRPVPVPVAAVPGGLVATVMTASTVPMLMLFSEGSWTEVVLTAVIFPCWLWGPALALAVWGYVMHRQQGSMPTGESDRPAPLSARFGSSRSPQPAR